jgi:hypothetical protein
MGGAACGAWLMKGNMDRSNAQRLVGALNQSVSSLLWLERNNTQFARTALIHVIEDDVERLSQLEEAGLDGQAAALRGEVLGRFSGIRGRYPRAIDSRYEAVDRYVAKHQAYGRKGTEP